MSPYTVKCQKVLVDDHNICMVLDFCKFGTLESYLMRQNRCLLNGNLSEKNIKLINCSILKTLLFSDIRGSQITHRDLKPANILIAREENFEKQRVMKIRLADYGFTTLNEFN